METQTFALFRLPVALFAGGVIGLAFGLIQNKALQRHERLQQVGKFKSGWAATPGSFRRVAYLLVALALVQFFCPVLFASGAGQACVSFGLVLGYGWVLFGQLRRRRA